jgi:uncharacterized protein Yka (UPF0111/DUF47 family)
MEAMRQSWSDDRLDDLQLEMRGGFARLETQIQQRIDQVEKQIELMEKRMDQRFEQVEQRLGQVEKRVDRVDERVEFGFGRLDGRIDKLAIAMFVSMMGLIATQLALVLS